MKPDWPGLVITSRVVGWLWLLVDLCVGQLCRRIAAGKGALVIGDCAGGSIATTFYGG